MDKEKTYIVSKSNELIHNVSFDLTEQEQKIIAYIASRIKPEDDDLLTQTIKYDDFLLLCGTQDSKGGAKAHLKNTIKKLADKSFWVLKEGD